MQDSEIFEMVNKYVDSVSIAGMEVCAVAVIMSAVGCVVGVLVLCMSDIMSVWFSSFGIGICTGFTIAFIAWGVGFGIYAIIKWFKMS